MSPTGSSLAPGRCDSRLERPHAELSREGLGLVKKCSRPLDVTGFPPRALEQHVRILELRVGQPGLRPHSGIHGQCLVKVRFGLLPPAHRCGKLPKKSPSPSKPVKQPAKPKEPTQEEIIEGARYAVSIGKKHLLTKTQKEALNRETAQS